MASNDSFCNVVAVQELRGNIRVYVRVKPLTSDEAASGITPVLRCAAEGSRIECLSSNSTKAFDFDHVFSPKSNQAQVFSEVAGLITSVLDGCAPFFTFLNPLPFCYTVYPFLYLAVFERCCLYPPPYLFYV